MFFDFDEDADFDHVTKHPEAAPPAGARRAGASSSRARAAPAGNAAEDLALLDEISAGAWKRFGEGPSSELRQQLLANLRAKRVEPLGDEWSTVVRSPAWQRVEICLRGDRSGSGEGWRTPEPGERIIVWLRACVAEPGGPPGAFRPLASSEETLDCILSDGALPEGVERALPRIAIGQTALVRCVGEMCLRDWPADHLEDVPAEGFLVWEVTLLKIVSVPGLDDPKRYTNHFVADGKQRLARANELRLRGNALLKAGRIVKAAEVYSQGESFTSLLEPEDTQVGATPRGLQPDHAQARLLGNPKEMNRRIQEAQQLLMLNRALAVQKQGDWRLSADICSDILQHLDPDCVKALFRRGKSRVRLKEFRGATEDLLRAQHLDESIEPQVKRELALLKRLARHADKSLLGTDPGKTLRAALAERPPGSGARGPGAKDGGAGGGAGQGGESPGPPAATRATETRQAETPTGGPVHADRGLKERVATVPGRVSVICPTLGSRGDRAPQLYACFLLQDVEDKELVVVDTGPCASRFFSCLSDLRVKYRHVPGPEDSMTIGAKRNYALMLASGEFVAHFDDDDLYAPPYLSSMLKALRSGGSHVAKLVAWHVLDVETGVCGHFDNGLQLPQPFEDHRQQGLFTGGYGFSFVYRREPALCLRFSDVSWGEDVHFAGAVKAAGFAVVFLRDTDFVCLHVQHGKNLSRSIAQTLVHPKTWLTFVAQMRHLAEQHLKRLDMPDCPLQPDCAPSEALPPNLQGVQLRGKWDHAAPLAPDVLAAATLGAKCLHSPEVSPLPVGLLVCSLYDEYFTGLQRSQQQGAAGPGEVDPLGNWRDNPKLGMSPQPVGKTGFVPSPLKPTESGENFTWARAPESTLQSTPCRAA